MNRDNTPLFSASAEASPSVFSDHDDDDEEEVPEPVHRPGKRRGGISTGSEDPSEFLNTALPVNNSAPKSTETINQLEEAVKTKLLFTHLEKEERLDVFKAMELIEFKSGETIIRQGDEGDYFYIVAEGTCDVWKQDTETSEAKCVMKVRQWDSFGELALIYNTPRAATVKATADCSLWRIDRVTYRHIIMGSQIRKRKLYDSFLEKVPILSSLDPYERLTVADALESCFYKDGDTIIREQEPGDAFYLIVSGAVSVTKKADQEKGVIELTRLGPSAYFGEIALLTDRPRAATVKAVGETKCVKLDRNRFTRVMGPCEEILRRNMSIYNQYVSVTV